MTKLIKLIEFKKSKMLDSTFPFYAMIAWQSVIVFCEVKPCRIMVLTTHS